MEAYIKDYNEWLEKQDINQMSNGLLNGRMGLSLYWYQQSRLFPDKDYKKIADNILDEVLNRIGIFTGVGFEDGLVGILLAINYLIREHYITGNINTIFNIVDDKLFQYAYFRGVDPIVSERNNIINLTWICTYFCQRLQSNSLSKENEYLIKHLIYELINSIEKEIRDDPHILNERAMFRPFSYLLPNLIILITEMYKMDLYSYKLSMFCRELTTFVASSIPLEYGNRFVLYYATGKLLNTGRKETLCFNDIFNVLHKLIENYSMIKMFRCNDLSLQEGLAGLLYYVYDDITDVSLLNDFKQKIIDNIQSGISSLWKNDKQFTLGSGMSGVFYIYQKMRLNYEKR